MTATAQKPHVEPVPGPVMRPPFRPGADRALTGIFLLAFLYGLHIAAPVFVPIAIAHHICRRWSTGLDSL